MSRRRRFARASGMRGSLRRVLLLPAALAFDEALDLLVRRLQRLVLAAELEVALEVVERLLRLLLVLVQRVLGDAEDGEVLVRVDELVVLRDRLLVLLDRVLGLLLLVEDPAREEVAHRVIGDRGGEARRLLARGVRLVRLEQRL